MYEYHISMIDRLMNEEEREIKIIEFIRANLGCLVEEAFKGVDGEMSRQTFFKTLSNLKNKKVVVAQKRNKREQSLYLNDKDPLIIITKSLDEFEYSYFELFDKILEEIKKPHESIEKRADILGMKTKRLIITRSHYELFNRAIFIFQKTVTEYMLDVSLKYQNIIKDKEHLSKIHAITLDRISKLYRKLFERIQRIDPEKHLKIKLNPNMGLTLTDLVIEDITYMGLDPGDMIMEMEGTFELFDLKSEYYNIPFTPRIVQSKK